MKKNNSKKLVLTLTALLLIFVLAFGGYTLSKYITSQNGTDSATVAKWGFTLNADASSLFGDKYKEGQVTAEEDGLAVKADSDTLAPGTSGSATFTVAGSAEVLAKISLTLSGTEISVKGTGEKALEYLPVLWKVNGTVKKGDQQTSLTETTARTFTELNKTLQTNLESVSVVNPSETVEVSIVLSWEWAFENNQGLTNATVDTKTYSTDELDTLLGSENQTVEGLTFVRALDFNATLTVEQLAAVPTA